MCAAIGQDYETDEGEGGALLTATASVESLEPSGLWGSVDGSMC